jgi:hypothetical protein
MSRDEEDRLFAQEMTRSTRRYQRAVLEGCATPDATRTACKASQARSAELRIAAVALLDASRLIRAQSAALRKMQKSGLTPR